MTSSDDGEWGDVKFTTLRTSGDGTFIDLEFEADSSYLATFDEQMRDRAWRTLRVPGNPPVMVAPARPSNAAVQGPRFRATCNFYRRLDLP